MLLAVVCACGSGGHTALPPTEQSLLWSAGVDPTQPDKRLPISPVVAAVKVTKRAGEITTVFQTKPRASCQGEVAFADRSRHQILPPAIADEVGLVRWTWTPAGTGRALARVVCSGGQRGDTTIRIS